MSDNIIGYMALPPSRLWTYTKWFAILWGIFAVLVGDAVITYFMLQATLAPLIFIALFATLKTNTTLIKTQRFWPCLREAIAWALMITYWAFILVISCNLFMPTGVSFLTTGGPADGTLWGDLLRVYDFAGLWQVAGRDLVVFFMDMCLLLFCTSFFRDKGIFATLANADAIILFVTTLAILAADASVTLIFQGITFDLGLIFAGFVQIIADRLTWLVWAVSNLELSVWAYWHAIKDQFIQGQGNPLFLTSAMPIVLLLVALTKLRGQQTPVNGDASNPFSGRITLIFLSVVPAFVYIIGVHGSLLEVFDGTERGLMRFVRVFSIAAAFAVFIMFAALILLGPLYATERMLRWSRATAEPLHDETKKRFPSRKAAP